MAQPVFNPIPPHHILKVTLNNISLNIYEGNIFNLKADVLVSPANENLDNSGGLAKQISDFAGQFYQDECSAWINNNGNLANGLIAITNPHNLSGRFKAIFHTVGPFIADKTTPITSEDENKLIEAIYQSLVTAETNKYQSISLPSISTGMYNYNIEIAAKNNLQAFVIFAGQYRVYNQGGGLNEINIFAFDAPIIDELSKELHKNFQIFDRFEYFGTSVELGNGLTSSYCTCCERSYSLDFFIISSNCCLGLCDICVYDYSTYQCRCGAALQAHKNRKQGVDYICRICLSFKQVNSLCNCYYK